MNKKLLVIMISILVVIASLGVGSYFLLKNSNSDEETEVEKELTIEEIIEFSVDTQMITTNLMSNNYARVQFRIQGKNAEGKVEIEQRLFQIENIIIRILANKHSSELSGREAIESLELKIKEEINALIDSSDEIVERVYTTTLMVQ